MTLKNYYLLLTVLLIGFIPVSKAQSAFKVNIGVIDSVYSNVLQESREIYVQLPESYRPGSDDKYPVIYILDGEIHLSAVYTVLSYYSGGFMPEMILVGISNAKNRTRDLTISSTDDSEEGKGDAEKFTDFIENELIPYVESKYPVTTYRTLIGHSYGGLFTVNTLLNHDILFENYLAIDPSLDWNDQQMVKQAEIDLSSRSFEGKSLFMSLGGQLHMADPGVTIDNVMQDNTSFTIFARSNIEFSEMAESNKQNGLNYYWKYYPKDLHGTISLPSVMDGLITLFDWFQMEDVDKFNDPETPKEVLYEIIKRREIKLKSHFKYEVAPFPEDLLNMLGYMSIDMGMPEKALMYFELNSEYYPESANAFDSLAEFYEGQKDYDKALENMTKAFEISGSAYHKQRIVEIKSK